MEKSRKDVRIMNKNRKIKRGLTTSLAVGMSVMMGAVPVFAAGTSSDADAVYKEETVYVNADAIFCKAHSGPSRKADRSERQKSRNNLNLII